MKHADPHEPSQFIRLLWLLAILFSPFAAVAYVWMYDSKVGNEAALLHVSLILAVSLIVIVICAIAQPLKHLDEDRFIKIGRGCACFAIFCAFIGAFNVRPHAYPLGALSFAGAFFCYTVWCYLTNYVWSRRL